MNKIQFDTQPNPDELDALYIGTINSSFVRTNPSYKELASKVDVNFLTQFLEKYDDGELVSKLNGKRSNWIHPDGINAFACHLGNDKYAIAVFEGLWRLYKYISISLGRYHIDKVTIGTDDAINSLILGFKKINNLDNLPQEDVDEMVHALDYIESYGDDIVIHSRAYFAGMMTALLGHELGHICLGHVLRDPTDLPSDVQLDIKRNNERTADLFAASVAHSSPYASYSLVAALFHCLTFYWHSKQYYDNADPKEQSTHPLFQERIRNLYETNEQKFDALGFTNAVIKRLMQD